MFQEQSLEVTQKGLEEYHSQERLYTTPVLLRQVLDIDTARLLSKVLVKWVKIRSVARRPS